MKCRKAIGAFGLPIGPAELRIQKLYKLGSLFDPSLENINAPGFVGNQHQKEVALENTATSFLDDTMKKTGLSESTIRKDASRGVHISDEAAVKLRGTPLDKGDYLDKLSKVPMKDQISVIEHDLSKKEMAQTTKVLKRGRPRHEDSPTTKGESVASFIFAHVDGRKMSTLIALLEGTQSRSFPACYRLVDSWLSEVEPLT